MSLVVSAVRCRRCLNKRSKKKTRKSRRFWKKTEMESEDEETGRSRAETAACRGWSRIDQTTLTQPRMLSFLEAGSGDPMYQQWIRNLILDPRGFHPDPRPRPPLTNGCSDSDNRNNCEDTSSGLGSSEQMKSEQQPDGGRGHGKGDRDRDHHGGGTRREEPRITPEWSLGR